MLARCLWPQRGSGAALFQVSAPDDTLHERLIQPDMTTLEMKPMNQSTTNPIQHAMESRKVVVERTQTPVKQGFDWKSCKQKVRPRCSSSGRHERRHPLCAPQKCATVTFGPSVMWRLLSAQSAACRAGFAPCCERLRTRYASLVVGLCCRRRRVHAPMDTQWPFLCSRSSL